jgi:hypothetical protein
MSSVIRNIPLFFNDLCAEWGKGRYGKCCASMEINGVR